MGSTHLLVFASVPAGVLQPTEHLLSVGSASSKNQFEEKSLSFYPREDCGGAQRKELECPAPLCLPLTGPGSEQHP